MPMQQSKHNLSLFTASKDYWTQHSVINWAGYRAQREIIWYAGQATDRLNRPNLRLWQEFLRQFDWGVCVSLAHTGPRPLPNNPGSVVQQIDGDRLLRNRQLKEILEAAYSNHIGIGNGISKDLLDALPCFYIDTFITGLFSRWLSVIP